MKIKIVSSPITKSEVRDIASTFYVTMVKGVADVRRGVLALGGEYHVDATEVLMKNGSRQADVWGFNLYIDKPHDERLEYTAMVNIRPHVGNPSMEIADSAFRMKIKQLVDSLLE